MHAATLAVDLSAIQANYLLLRQRLNGRLCGAVVKANAYGLGVERVAPALALAGCEHFFVATLEEGMQLRGILPESTIYIFNGLLPGESPDYAAHRLMPVLNDMPEVERFLGSDAIPQAALHIDTGMTRLGVGEGDVAALAARWESIGHRFSMAMSHLACANEPLHPKNEEQRLRFDSAFRRLPNGIAASLANSSGIFLDDRYHYDLARPGCALYGINPSMGENPMHHVATLSAPLLQIRILERDEEVGYGATYPAKKGSRIAIVALGYADGWLRGLSPAGHAYLAGRRVPLAGRVSMDMLALDVSAVPEALLTSEMRAEFINAQQPVDAVAEAGGTIGYEIFTRIGARVKRNYLTGA